MAVMVFQSSNRTSPIVVEEEEGEEDGGDL